MNTTSLFAEKEGDYIAILKLLNSEAQKYGPGDENCLYRLYRVAVHYCGEPTNEMRDNPEYINAMLRLIKLSQWQTDRDKISQTLFGYMEQHKVGYRDAKRYQKEAAWLLSNGEEEKALKLLNEGIRRGAQPRETLQSFIDGIKPRSKQHLSAVQRSPTPSHGSRATPVNGHAAQQQRHQPQPKPQQQRQQPQQPPHKAVSSSDPGHRNHNDRRDVSPLPVRPRPELSDSDSDSDSDSIESEHERVLTQLSPIAENAAQIASDCSQSKYNRPPRTGQTTPRDMPVNGHGYVTPQPRGGLLRTPSNLENRLQTPSNERHVIYVNEKPYTKIKVIGRGGSCKVYKVSCPDGIIYALKRVVATRGKAFDSFRNEVNVLEQLRGKENIIQMIDYEVDKPNRRISIVLEYGECDFAHYLMSDPVLGIDEIRGHWKAMLLAVQDIHLARIVHSDLKPQNYMLVRGKLKLIDFGIAKDIPNDTTNIQRDQTYGTLSYMSPEANDRGCGAPVKLGRSSDIWSLGIILYQLVYKKPPFEHLNPLQRYLTLSDPKTSIEFRDVTERDVPNSTIEDRKNLVRVLQSCLLYNPRERFTIPQLLDHPLLLPPSIEIDQDTFFRNMKLFLSTIGTEYGVASGGSVDIAEDQVCATFLSNLCSTTQDTEPFRRFAQLIKKGH